MEGTTVMGKENPLFANAKYSGIYWLIGNIGARAVERPRTYRLFSSGRDNHRHRRHGDLCSDSLLYCHRQGALEPRSQ
jgi:hypothetical protein